jgi:hypothetical protein
LRRTHFAANSHQTQRTQKSRGINLASTRNKTIAADNPAFDQYYALLAEYREQRVHHEGAVSTAFENLLAQLSKERGWVFIPLLAVVGKRIIPDGTIRDANGLPRAYWEAGRPRTRPMILMLRLKEEGKGLPP